jgi:hypothetical protein
MRWPRRRDQEQVKRQATPAEDVLDRSVDDIEESAQQLKKVSEKQLDIARRLRSLQVEAELIARRSRNA